MSEPTKKKRKAESVLPGIAKASLSGAATGGILGGVERLLSGARKADILRGSLAGAGIYGGVTAGSQAIGGLELGAADPDDPHAMTTRGLVGGLTAGGIGGAALGGLAAAGHVKLPLPKLLEEYYRTLGKGGRWLEGSAMGAGAGMLGGGYIGRSEGQEADTWRGDDLKRRRYGEP